MKLAKGPRPREVHVFALVFTAIGLWNFARGLSDLTQVRTLLEYWTVSQWSRDAVIVAVSARFTIVLIPVIAVWAFASTIARILVTIMAALSLLLLIEQVQLFAAGAPVDRFRIASVLAGAFAVMYLYTVPARYWFREGAHGVAKAFE